MNTPSARAQEANQKLALKMIGLIGAGAGIVGIGAAFFVLELTQTAFMGSVGWKYAPKLPAVPAERKQDAPQCNPQVKMRWMGCVL